MAPRVHSFSLVASLSVAVLSHTWARADSYVDGMIFGVGVGVPLGLVATGGAIAGGLSSSDRGRPGAGAMIYALSSGALATTWGGLLLYQGARTSGNRHLQFLPGVFDIGAGVTAIVITLVRNGRAPSSTSAWQPAVVPALGLGRRREPVVGLQLVWNGPW